MLALTFLELRTEKERVLPDCLAQVGIAVWSSLLLGQACGAVELVGRY